jgi:hypothetical protein
MHLQQRGLRGVARTKLTFSSDRDGLRLQGPIANRDIKEIYIADYDGASQRRVTVNRPEHLSGVVARRPVDCLHVVPARVSRHLHLEHLPGHARNTRWRHRSRAQLAGGVVARRVAYRVHVEPRRQSGDLRHEPRRERSASPDEPPGHRLDADVVAGRQRDGVHVGSDRRAADLRRLGRRVGSPRRSPKGATPIGRPGPRRPSTRSPTPLRTGPGYDIEIYDVASASAGRSRSARGATRARCSRRTGATWRSRRRGAAGAGVHDRTRRPWAPPGDDAGKQLHAELVAVVAQRAAGLVGRARREPTEETTDAREHTQGGLRADGRHAGPGDAGRGLRQEAAARRAADPAAARDDGTPDRPPTPPEPVPSRRRSSHPSR